MADAPENLDAVSVSSMSNQTAAEEEVKLRDQLQQNERQIEHLREVLYYSPRQMCHHIKDHSVKVIVSKVIVASFCIALLVLYLSAISLFLVRHQQSLVHHSLVVKCTGMYTYVHVCTG